VVEAYLDCFAPKDVSSALPQNVIENDIKGINVVTSVERRW
jgi:hypothetical protein